MTIFTIGYEGLSVDAFMTLLAKYGIETIVDVRQMPLSRKPGFSKKALASTLNLSGLNYVHMVALGCPKPVRDRYRENGSWRYYTKEFLKHLKTQKTAVNELAKMAASSVCALLCYEADFNFCHRSIVANAVQNTCGADVKHIKTMNIKTAEPASLQLALPWA